MFSTPIGPDEISGSSYGEGARGTTVTGAAVPPWNSEDFYPETPSLLEPGWGYFIEKALHSATFEQLRSYISGDRSKRIKLVWTPGSTRMVRPEEVPELLPEVRQRNIIAARQQLRNYLLISLLYGGLAALNFATTGTRGNVPFISYFILPLVLGIIPAAQIAWSLRQMRTHEFTREDAFEAGQYARFGEWVARHRAPLTVSLIVALLVVGVVQVYLSLERVFDGIFDSSPHRTWSAIDAAGLVKSAVWNGDIWRLFTGSVLHGSIWHFFFNVLALYVFGKIVEVAVGWAYVPIVFFFSALAGSVLSVLLLPATSVGSSGGIMGIVGFLAVLGYYNRDNLPPGFLKSILQTVAFVALFGLAAFVLIDNAAHAGGALCGALLGYLLLPHGPAALPLKPGGMVKALAVLCTLGLLASVIGSLVAMFTWR